MHIVEKGQKRGKRERKEKKDIKVQKFESVLINNTILNTIFKFVIKNVKLRKKRERIAKDFLLGYEMFTDICKQF